MSRDNFDKEMSTLYQQRKAQLVAPKISFNTPKKARRLSPLSLLTIFSVGGIASFGIMALISHLSHAPEVTTPLYSINHDIKLVKVTPVEDEKDVMAIPPPLPPKPAIKPPHKTGLLHVNKPINNNFIEPERIVTAQVQLVTVPLLAEPTLAIKPIYKVMPKYPFNPQQGNKSGMIQLNYQVSSAGAVENITMVKSTLSKKLQLSAKKALAQWQYPAHNNFDGQYEIIFEFKGEKN